MVKKATKKKNFYLPILSKLKYTSNLTKIRNELGLKKQNLNYYLRQLEKKGLILSKGNGVYELTEKGKNPSKYGNLFEKDSIRGHAYIWTVNLIKKPDNWNKRINILDSKKINYKLVGAKENTPRIKALGRKVWLCNNHLRIFDIEDSSYYGKTALESRKNAFTQLLKIVNTLENKLGFLLKPFNWEFRKEHYALIKNDLAIEHNKKGIILRISDQDGEWLLIDDSLGKGGELETIGKKAFETNIPMQKWWNNQKETNFKVTPEFILNGFDQMFKINQDLEKNIKSHLALIKEYRKENIKWRKGTLKEIEKNKFQKTLGDF